ncbi:hypothetical protein LEP1GSC100_4424 [Leptospira interrogans serovar Bataviae str. UI 08561]|nr:hypothetical protein LEP1GSC100_4424 [Leptospira interrogans serovar Bataviae str. UI 08561]
MSTSTISFYGFLIFLLSGCSPIKEELPYFSPNLECSKEEIPLFIQPAQDVETGNRLEMIYCSKTETILEKKIELSLVFQDERHPSIWKDKVYRIYRGFKYGRHKDIETLLLEFSKKGELLNIHLKNVYSGEQRFAADPVHHFDSILKSEQIMRDEGKPVLFINTWNHMFSETNMNPELSEKKLNSIELRTGSREKLDSFYLEK